jgi:hypothetical protein
MSPVTKRLHLALAIALAIGAPAVATAQPDATCTVLEINATTGDKASIPEELKPLEKKLKKKPFSSWNVFTVKAKASKTIAQGKSDAVTLSQGKATVLYGGTQQSGKKTRLSLTLTAEDANGKQYANTKVNIDPGDYIVIGRTLPNDDGHLVALTCK